MYKPLLKMAYSKVNMNPSCRRYKPPAPYLPQHTVWTCSSRVECQSLRWDATNSTGNWVFQLHHMTIQKSRFRQLGKQWPLKTIYATYHNRLGSPLCAWQRTWRRGSCFCPTCIWRCRSFVWRSCVASSKTLLCSRRPWGNTWNNRIFGSKRLAVDSMICVFRF